MECQQCKLVEMLVKKVDGDIVEYVCKKCGNTHKETLINKNKNSNETSRNC